MQNLSAILEEAGTGLDRLVKTTVFLQDLGDFAAMNEVYAPTSATPARPLDGGGGEAPDGRAGRDRGGRCSEPSNRLVLAAEWGRCGARSRTTCIRSGSTPTSSAGPSATSCSGSAAGARLRRPRRRPRRAAGGAGALRQGRGPRRRRSARRRPPAAARPSGARAPTGRDRVRPAARRALDRPRQPRLRDRRRQRITLEQDMERRDFTINAIARRLETGELARPARRPRRPRAARPPHNQPRQLPRRPAPDRPRPALRLAVRLRAGQGHTAPDARLGTADPLRLGRADRWRPGRGRHGGAVEAAAGVAPRQGAAARPRRRRAPPRSCPSSSPPSATSSPAPGRAGCSTSTSSRSSRPPRTRMPRWRCASAALLHDLAKPETDRDGGDHAARGAVDRGSRCCAASGIRGRMVQYVTLSPPRARVPSSPQNLDGRRRAPFSALPMAHGSLSTCSSTRAADLAGQARPAEEHKDAAHPARDARRPGALECLIAWADLAVDGSDLIAIGFRESPVARRRCCDEALYARRRGSRA